jgi:hypothetical protein
MGKSMGFDSNFAYFAALREQQKLPISEASKDRKGHLFETTLCLCAFVRAMFVPLCEPKT